MSKRAKLKPARRPQFPAPAPAPSRPRVTQESLVRNALALLHQEGFDGLTMRGLAECSGIRAASLYNHVRDKAELLALIADAICAEIPPIQPAGNWRRQLRKLAVQFRAALLRHRDGARVFAATPPLSPRRLRIVEQVLTMLIRAGFSAADATAAASVHNSYIVGFVLDETLERPADRASLRRMRGQARRWFNALPREQYPTLVAFADALARTSADRHFDFGLRALLAGFAMRLPRKRT